MSTQMRASHPLCNWEDTLEEKWATLRFGDVNVQTNAAQHISEAKVYLHDLNPQAVRVELYAVGVKGSVPEWQDMKSLRQPASASGSYVYSPSVPATRPVTDYTARVILHCDGIAVPQEDARFLWQR